MSAPVGDRADVAAQARGWQRWWPWGLLALVTLYCHWFILTNDGPVWDGWFWEYWLGMKRWEPMVEYTRAQGIPYTLWAFAPFAYLPAMIPWFMVASVVCLVAESWLFYALGRRLARLARGEALAVAALAQAIPLFSGAQDFPAFGLIVFHVLFLFGAYAATRALEKAGRAHWMWRGAALVAFYFSCITNGALLVFYGALWVLLLARFRRMRGRSGVEAARSFILSYPDFFLVPPAVYAARMAFMPQFGWYENYNKPGANLSFVHETFWSFFENVIPFHAKATGMWLWEHPVWSLLLAAAVWLWWWRGPRWEMERSATSTGQWLGFGALALVFAVFPLAAGGKFFEETPIGETSRHCLLAGLPVAVLLVGTLRWLAQFAGGVGRRLLPAVLACAVVIFGAQYWPIYFGERVETLTSRSMLHHAVSHPDVRRASVIVNADTTATRQRIYGICSFARAFGELTRLVSPYPPRSQGGYLPSEVEWHSLCTTVLASEFNRIDPSGTHLVLQTERLRGAATDAQIAWRELHARWLGGPGERERFLASLTALRLGLLRERTPLVPAGAPSAASRPVGDFTNGAGIEMVRLPWGGWAARYETTQSQYEGVMARNPSLFPDPWRPVERVSWLEAEEFCHRLNAMESARLPAGVSYRLPTAAEFERLCGDAWAVRAVIVGLGVGSTTAGVGMYPANEWGLHDTVGNVWEWCLDWWDAAERFRVSKGGAFSSELPHLDRNAWRAEDRSFPVSRRIWLLGASAERLLGRTHRDYPDQAYWNRGFRVVLAAPPPARLPPLRASER